MGEVSIEVEVPTESYAAYLAHLHELTWELRIIKVGAESGQPEPEADIRHLIAEVLSRYASIRDQHRAEFERACAQGAPTVTLRTVLPVEAVDVATADALHFLGLLEQADDLCGAERLLTLPADENLVKFRRWYIEESVSKLRKAAQRAAG